MSSRLLLRAAAIIYALFALGHTVGGMFGDTHRNPRQAQVFAAMRTYTFHVQGVTRSYWDFYRGFGFMVSVLLAFTAVLCWVVGDMSRTNPRDARRVLAVLTGAMALTTWFSFADFFAAPMVFSAVAMVVLAAALIVLGRESSHSSFAGAVR